MIDRLIRWLLEGVYYSVKDDTWNHRPTKLTNRLRIALAGFLMRRVL